MPTARDGEHPLYPGVSAWLPGETLYSLACRECRLSGEIRPAWLAGLSAPHDLPFALAGLGPNRLREIGGADVAALQHTVLPYYLAVQRQRRRTRILEVAREGHYARLKVMLGLCATWLRAAHPLKACLECIREDESLHGVAYWHVAHQHPGIWLCLRHAQPLLLAREKWTGAHRLVFLLPRTAALEASAAHALDTRSRQALRQLAEFTLDLVECAKAQSLSAEQARLAYTSALQEQGLCHANGQVRQAQMAAALRPMTDALRSMGKEFAELGEDLSNDVNGLLQLTASHHSNGPPLKYLVLAAALFPSWGHFVRQACEGRAGPLTNARSVRRATTNWRS